MRDDGRLAVSVRADAKNAEMVRHKYPGTTEMKSPKSRMQRGRKAAFADLTRSADARVTSITTTAFSAAFAASHSASISARRRVLRRLAARGQRALDRGKAPFEFQVGRAQDAFRVGVEMAGEIDHREQQIADLGCRRGLRRCASSSASISSASSRILASTARGSFQSKPTRPALFCSFSARVNAGRATGTPASAPLGACLAALGLFLGLDPLPQALDRLGGLALGVGKDVRMAADQLGGDGLDHVGEIEGALLLRHAGVENDLQQQIAEFVLEPVEIAARDGVGHLIGFLERVGRDGGESLLEVPRAAGAGRAQRRHDLDQAGDVAGGLHRCSACGAGLQERRP